MQQPKIRDDLMHKLNRIATAYEMDAMKVLNHVVAVALDELDGKQDDYTVCIPVRLEVPPVDLLAEPEPETRSNYHPDADPWEYGDR